MTGRRVLGALVALGLVLAVAGLGTGWWLARGEDVPVPPDDASAEEVVTAYVDAINARDGDTLAALRRDGDLPVQVTGSVLLEGRTTYAGLQVRPALDDLTGDPVTDAVRVAYVPVDFDLQRTWAPFPDVSMPEGPTGWGYRLERDGSSGPWRIVDEGTG